MAAPECSRTNASGKQTSFQPPAHRVLVALLVLLFGVVVVRVAVVGRAPLVAVEVGVRVAVVIVRGPRGLEVLDGGLELGNVGLDGHCGGRGVVGWEVSRGTEGG